MNLSLISLRELGMKTVMFRTIEVLLNVAILATAVQLLLILYFSGYSLSLSFMTIKVQNVAPPTILLMALILSRVSMRCYASAGKNLSAHIPVILFCALLILYLANGVTKASGDTLPARYLPFSILREGNFDLNEFQFLYAQGIPYYLRHLNSRYVSNYPVGPALAALPFYLIPALGAVPPTDKLIADLEKTRRGVHGGAFGLHPLPCPAAPGEPASFPRCYRDLCLGDQQFQHQQPSALATWA
jgi:hypothetical protein